jgi:dihydropyrimidinase
MTDSELMFDMVLQGGDVVLERGVQRLDVGIRGERIAGLLTPGMAGDRAASTVDVSGKFVLPGGIDTHTHIAWPLDSGGRSLDTFDTATQAAARSGTTTVLDFVPPHRGDGHVAAAQQRLAEAEGHCAVDYSFRPILTAGAAGDVARLAQLGLRSFKIFTTYNGMRLSDGEISEVMDAIGDVDGLAGFHAENHELVEYATDATIRQRGRRIAHFPSSRPALAEEAAIDLVALYAREKQVPIFIFHISGAAGVRAVERARSLGATVHAETCTHYLTVDESVYSQRNGWMFVITPPVRSVDDQSALWQALRTGTLTCVGSDHCAYGLVHKHPDADDFTAMTAGAPGIDVRMPLVWSEGVGSGRLSAVEFAHVTATGPAKTFGLYPRKGTIKVGSDADFVVVDPSQEWEWRDGTNTWGSDYEPYAGRRGTGVVTTTILRGRIIAEDGAVVQDKLGEFLPQSPIPN